MPIIRNTVVDGALAPAPLARVHIQPVTGDDSPAFVTGGKGIALPTTLVAATDGRWSTSLTPTEPGTADYIFQPLGTRYLVREEPVGEDPRYTFCYVPNGGGPYDLADLKVEGLGVEPSASMLLSHIQSPSDPHAAAGYKHPHVARRDSSQGLKPGAYTVDSPMSFIPYPGGSAYDITLPVKAGEVVKVQVNGFAGSEDAVLFLDCATLDPSDAPIRWMSTDAATPAPSGVWVATPGTTPLDYQNLAGAISRTIPADEIFAGLVRLRMFVATYQGSGSSSAKLLIAGALRTFFWEATRDAPYYVG